MTERGARERRHDREAGRRLRWSFRRPEDGEPRGNVFLVLSIVFALVACIFCPLVFGVLSIFFGFVSFAMEGPMGALGALAGVVGTVIGFSLGAFLSPGHVHF